MGPIRAGKIWEQLSHTCFSFIPTASASFVALTRMCMHGLALLLRDHHRCIIQIYLAAIAVTLVVSVAASSHTREIQSIITEVINCYSMAVDLPCCSCWTSLTMHMW